MCLRAPFLGIAAMREVPAGEFHGLPAPRPLRSKGEPSEPPPGNDRRNHGELLCESEADAAHRASAASSAWAATAHASR